MKTSFFPILILVLIFAVPSTMAAQKGHCPGPALSIPRGLYVRANVGPSFWLGDVGKYARPGLGLSFGLAYEWFSFLATELTYNVGLHDTDQQAPPAPGSFTTHGFYGGIRLNLPIAQFDLFGRGGIGAQWSTPDILVRVNGFDKDTHLAWLAGLGFIWHTPRRHFWLGLEAQTLGAVDFPGILLDASVVVGCNL